jgi:hypothetical protein
MSDFENNHFYSNNAFQQLSDPEQTSESFPGNVRQTEQNGMGGRDSDMVDARNKKDSPRNQDGPQSSNRSLSTSSPWVDQPPQPVLFGSSGTNDMNMNIFQYQRANTAQGISDNGANIMFGSPDAIQLQQQASSSNLFDLNTRFNNVGSGFDPNTFTSSLDQLSAFSFGGTPDFTTAGDISMNFDNMSGAQMSDGVQNQAMNNFFTNPSYAPPFDTGAGTMVQDDWLGGSSGFDIGGSVTNAQHQLSHGLDQSRFGAQLQPPQIHQPLPIVSGNPPQTSQNNNNSPAYTSSLIPAG